MDNLDGTVLQSDDFKQWCCENGHAMGVSLREKVSLRAGATTLRYFTTRLLIFQNSVDMDAERPTEIEVSSSIDGRILSMTHKCSVCGATREWHPQREVVEFLASTYVAE